MKLTPDFNPAEPISQLSIYFTQKIFPLMLFTRYYCFVICWYTLTHYDSFILMCFNLSVFINKMYHYHHLLLAELHDENVPPSVASLGRLLALVCLRRDIRGVPAERQDTGRIHTARQRHRFIFICWRIQKMLRPTRGQRWAK